MKKIAMFAAIFLLIVGSLPVQAHSWYPWECCGGRDCAPVQDTTRAVTKDGVMRLVVTSKYGKAVVPDSLPRRQSRDTRMHICMRYDAFGDLKVICLFVPPSMEQGVMGGPTWNVR